MDSRGRAIEPKTLKVNDGFLSRLNCSDQFEWIHAEKSIDHVRVKLPSSLRKDFIFRKLPVPSFFVWPFVRQSIENVGDGDNPSFNWNLIAF